MAIDRNKFRKIKNGVGYEAALILSDSTQTPVPATTVAAPTALTSVVAAGATPTKAEYDALRVDVTNLRTTVASLLANLKTAGTVK